jgi:hypothetical protein
MVGMVKVAVAASSPLPAGEFITKTQGVAPEVTVNCFCETVQPPLALKVTFTPVVEDAYTSFTDVYMMAGIVQGSVKLGEPLPQLAVITPVAAEAGIAVTPTSKVAAARAAM